MRRWMLLSSLGLLFVGLGLADTIVVAAQANWTTLPNCQLLPNPANDGDSFHVMANGREHIFRLYFVDAPETDNRYPHRLARQAAYFRISTQSALRIGGIAKQFSLAKLSRPFTVITRWEDARGQSHLPRFYAVVRLDGRDLGKDLVENGLARIFGKPAILPDGTAPSNERAKLRNLENQAKAFRRGAWAYSTNVPNAPPQSTSSTKSAPASVKSKQTSAGAANQTTDAETTQYRISADGIRHNSNCRYFNGMTTRPCGPNDGRPCKICGG